MKQTHRYNEHFDGYERGGDVGDWVEKVKGGGSTNWQSQNSRGDVMSSLGHMVGNTVITCMVPGGCWKYWGERFVKFMIV